MIATKKIVNTFFFNKNDKIATDEKSEFFQKFNGQPITIKSYDGLLLKGHICQAENEKRIILALHGYKSSPEKDFKYIAGDLINNGCTIIFADSRAHGESEGKLITFGIKERHDCFSWINYINENISAKLPLYIYGISMGGATALMTSGMKLPSCVHGIISDSAYSSVDEMVKYKLEKEIKNKTATQKVFESLDKYLIKNYNFSLYDFSVEEAFKSNSRPVLLFHGAEDKVTPSSMCHKIKTLSKTDTTVHIFSECNHCEAQGKRHKAYLSKITGFFNKYDSITFSDEIKLNYPEKKMYDVIYDSADKLPDDYAYNFMGKNFTYKQFLDRVHSTAKSFVSLGIKKDDVVTICMPNTPQAIDSLYALNKIGAVASFIHPLSAQNEIKYYLELSQSKMIITPDLFYEKVIEAVKNTGKDITVVVARIQDTLSPVLKAAYCLKKGKDYLKFPDSRGGIVWSNFIKHGKKLADTETVKFNKNKTSVILYSGGTTANPKGICLSDYNFNALAMQGRVAMECEFSRGLKNLSAMPMFHGFGLGIGIHLVLANNACCVLMPTVDTKGYATMLLKEKPNFIAGVPTIFKMLIKSEDLKDKDLSFLKGMFVGGDSMPVPLKNETDEFLKEHNAGIQVREGYGLTECVTASCLTPKDSYKEGSIGLPFPDMKYKIVKPSTEEEIPAGEEGEIIISGPTVMLGYKDNKEETEKVLKTHSDGSIWLHTGDLGKIDSDGYIYFHQRAKRMIITSGYNVSPVAVENAINSYENVEYSCVIGVKDEFKIEKIKAYVVLKDSVKATEETKQSIIEHCKKYIAHYALPKEIEFRNELPKTLVGKVAYRKLEEEMSA